MLKNALRSLAATLFSVRFAFVGRTPKTAICAVSHETTLFGRQKQAQNFAWYGASPTKQSHLAADSLCILCPERSIRGRNILAATLLPGLLTTRGAPKHRAERAKIRLSPQKVGKRGFVGACRALAPCPKCRGSPSVSLMRRKKTSLYSRNTKRFSEKQLDRATRQETVIRNNGTDNFQTHFMLVSMSLPAPGTMSSPY